MDLRRYFQSASSSSAKDSACSSRSSVPTASIESDHSDNELVEDTLDDLQPRPAKKPCTSTTARKYRKEWEKDFLWLEYDEDTEGVFCKVCRQAGKSYQQSGGVWVSKPFSNWKKAVEKMKAHERSENHIQAKDAVLVAEEVLRKGSVIQQLQKAERQERARNREAIKSLIRCTHFLVRNHVAHTTNFQKLVDLVVSCGGESLKLFMASAQKNAVYTSHIAVVDFVEALGTWVEESSLVRLRQASYYSIMADECTDISNVEELSLFCRWETDGVTEEHFLEILPLKKADAESICSTIIECLKGKNLQVSKIIGMGFDGARTFSGNRSGVQTRLKKYAPYAMYVHCHCHLLQLACVQAANSTPGIKHVYTTLTALWKFFHYSPKKTESLKEVQRVLDMPELKIIKPSDTRWLAHERCVKAVKASYSAIVTCLDNIHDSTHEPEALGLSKALCKKSTIAAVYLLDYTLPQVVKLSRTLQTEDLDLSVVSSLVEATLHTLDDALLPAANWVLEILEDSEDLEKAAGTNVTSTDIRQFQESVAKPFLRHLKDNISSRFASSGQVIGAFSIFNPKKLPNVESSEFTSYGDESLKILMEHYGKDKDAETLQGEATVREAILTSDISTEWKTFCKYMSKEMQENTKSQLMALASNSMLKTMFPNLHKLASINLTLPVATASVERSFFQMKLIKTRLRNSLSESSVSHLMKIAIESPDTLTDSNLEEVVNIWHRKGRRIAV